MKKRTKKPSLFFKICFILAIPSLTLALLFILMYPVIATKEAITQWTAKPLIESNPELYMIKNWLQIQLRANDKIVPVNIPKELEGEQLINFVNHTVNQIITSKEDLENYDVGDYWATPEEALKNGGDCEDYAITKYFILKQHGINPSNMVLVGLLDTELNGYHAVLYVKQGNKTFLLDNRTDLTPEYRAKYYKEIVAVNDFIVARPKKLDYGDD